MGLDMYLAKKVYISREDRNKLRITGIKRRVDPSKVEYIVEEVGYWRKANAIHRWFVDNVQEGVDNCGGYYVAREQLQELLDLVNQVLANHSLAGELLPTQSGFFFGSTDYDEYYFSDLKDTKDILERTLAGAESDYEYSSSW